MKKALVISDAGPIFSLALLDKLQLLDFIFQDVKIPIAVWQEISTDKTVSYYPVIESFFKNKKVRIKGFNDLKLIMDYGESEALILYKELNADFLLIDDKKKARKTAESPEVNCVGTIGILSVSKTNGHLEQLRPLFCKLLENNRYYSLKLLNQVLVKHDEETISVS